MKRRTDKFTAPGDDNRNYTIHVYTDFIAVGSHDDPGAEIEGLRTSEGMLVNF
jgi:hypothetical protein